MRRGVDVREEDAYDAFYEQHVPAEMPGASARTFGGIAKLWLVAGLIVLGGVIAAVGFVMTRGRRCQP